MEFNERLQKAVSAMNAVNEQKRQQELSAGKPPKHQDNQKTITEIIKSPCDKDNIYAMFNLDAMEKAMKTLSTNAFRLWIYLGKNNASYKNWELSSKDAMEWLHCCRSTYDKAVNELIEKKYLVYEPDLTNEVANNWIFYDVPKKVSKVLL